MIVLLYFYLVWTITSVRDLLYVPLLNFYSNDYWCANLHDETLLHQISQIFNNSFYTALFCNTIGLNHVFFVAVLQSSIQQQSSDMFPSCCNNRTWSPAPMSSSFLSTWTP